MIYLQNVGENNLKASDDHDLCRTDVGDCFVEAVEAKQSQDRLTYDQSPDGGGPLGEQRFSVHPHQANDGYYQTSNSKPEHED